MPVIQNAKWERFAQFLAKGKTIEASYSLAGYKPHRGNAHRLSTYESVRRRVAEIQGRAAKRVEVTIESLTTELEEARQIAVKGEQASGAVAATMGKAKLHGLIVEKRQHSGAIGTYDLTRLTDEQLDQLEIILGPLAPPDADGDPGGEGEERGGA